MRSTFHIVAYVVVSLLLAGNLLAQTAIITTAAGTGTAGFSGDNGAATAALINGPADIAIDAAGNVFIADRDNQRVRKIAAGTGVITTVAGTGAAGFSGDTGGGPYAALNRPSGVAVDGGGNLYIADFQNNRIRVVTPGGIINSLEVWQFFPKSQLPGANDPFWKTIENLAGIKFFKDGFGLPVSLSGPTGVVVDAAGNVYAAEQTGQRIRKIEVGTGFVSTIAGTGEAGFSGDGGPATEAEIHNPTHLTMDSAGNIYFSDSLNNRIRKITPSGTISTVAGSGGGGFGGDGGPATSAQLNKPGAVAVDSRGDLFIADTLNKRLRMVSAGSGVITTIAGGGSTGDGCAASTSSLESPQSVMVNPAGNLIYIADDDGNRIRLVSFGGTGSKPTLASIDPATAPAGTNAAVKLSGAGFFSCTGATMVSVGGNGITVTNMNVAGDSSITATFAIAPSAEVGAHNVTVATEGGTTAAVLFTVEPPAPALTSITPPSAVRNSSSTLTLSGSGFDTVAGATHVVPGNSGVSITEVHVASAESLTASFTVAADAALGETTITVVTERGASNTLPLSVLPEAPTFVYEIPKMLNPTDQSPIKVSLANTHAEPVTGTLTLTFMPNAANAIDDPNVTFINSQTSTRTADVTFAANTSTAELSIPSGVLQAGTEAGTIQLAMMDVKLGGLDVTPVGDEFTVEVPRLVPIITSIRIINRTAGGFDVEVTGYSTSREITAATFNFAEASGANLLTVQLRPDVVSTFTTYYQSPISGTAGGAFVYLQPFLIQQGDSAAVASVTVTLTNAQGNSKPATAQ